MPRVFVAVGSNLGDREENIRRARSLLSKVDGISIEKMSPIYETEPVGGPPQGKFLNAVWEIGTNLKPREVLRELNEIESALGRERDEKNAPRTMDLDILFYDQQIITEKGLEIPHPRLHERGFVLKPMIDLAADWMHPKLQKNMRQLFQEVNKK